MNAVFRHKFESYWENQTLRYWTSKCTVLLWPTVCKNFTLKCCYWNSKSQLSQVGFRVFIFLIPLFRKNLSYLIAYPIKALVFSVWKWKGTAICKAVKWWASLFSWSTCVCPIINNSFYWYTQVKTPANAWDMVIVYVLWPWGGGGGGKLPYLVGWGWSPEIYKNTPKRYQSLMKVGMAT